MTEREQIASMDRAIGRIEGKLDGFIEEIRAGLADHRVRIAGSEVGHDQRFEKIEGRIVKVENRQHWYAGAGTVIGAIASWFGLHLVKSG